MPPRTTRPTRVIQRGEPDFIRAIKDDYQAQISHLFLLYGNIYDFVDNAGSNLGIKKVLACNFDDNIQRGLNPDARPDSQEIGVQQTNARVSEKVRVMAFYNTSQGLEFPDTRSYEMFKDAFKQIMGDEAINEMGEDYFHPGSPDSAMMLFNKWFSISKQILMDNEVRKAQQQTLRKELVMTLVITDADALFPRGEIANLVQDRAAIINARNWAQDTVLGSRNRIILMTRHISDIQDSIRGELAVSHVVRKPNLQDRTEWITNFNQSILRKVELDGALKVGDNLEVRGIDFASDFNLAEFANQSAGMNRKQLKDVILNSWRSRIPLDFPMVQERKKRALDDEYGGILDIKEPTFGFDQIGGHEHFKDYCRWEIIKPLKEGNRKLCSRGALMTGPPGTGKTMIAWALAYEAGVNFLQVDLGKVFGGIVGETEKNMRKLIEAIEAAAPCIAFFDEVDSVLSSGRSGGGDSGTSARMFNNLMTWLSDPGRQGKVVALMASNRPDLLDAALIRAGRIDVKIPMLPPVKGDNKGRWSILAAQTRKQKMVLSPELEATKDKPGQGLGQLLFDKKRIWTGAEIEQLLVSAYRRMTRQDRKLDGKLDLTIQLDDWNHAFKVVVPNTREVEKMINLALVHVDNFDYCPLDWIARAEELQLADAA
jgi:transitional endoplasmic reticulum ATPase